MRGLPSILSLFRNELYKFNNTKARMLDSIFHDKKDYLEISFLALKGDYIVIMYETLLWTS